ncbi:lipocalin-like domain-containing protein [Bradyrhizobium sp. Pear76]|uniref:lipocalin-like domain-containing protein n=1 Tax=Bradyrhizobium oropedii TaxID=1571201 RepID=UPI001E3FB523|nr:lipocalin-like domain-containing protein [Bradyrhizobium oropedii]MCC8960979.1 lipocalin-like domain-containing protein [Bradyrhizobium oropedii]
MVSRVVALLSAFAIVIGAAQAGNDDLKPLEKIVGTWRLVAASPTSPLQAGFITYTGDGRMSAILRHGGRKPLTTGDRISASVEERAEAFATLFAYAGSYDVVGDKIVHHVEIASVENWVNTDLIRLVRFDGDRITLTTPPLSVGGKIQTTELVWERVR